MATEAKPQENANQETEKEAGTELDNLLENTDSEQEVNSDESATPGAGDALPEGDKGDKGAADAGDDPAVKIAKLEGEIAEMRAIFRSQRNQTTLLQQKLDETRRQLTEGGTISEPTPEEKEALQARQSKRQDELETFLESMRLSAKYEDVDKVVSQARADDIIEAMAKEFATKNNIPVANAITEVTNYVWLQVKNPYRFLYEKIKSAHPDFAKKDGDAEGKKAAPSLANLGAGDGGKGKGVKDGQWTSARIDELPENRLGEVPEDVYKKYMQGTLD